MPDTVKLPGVGPLDKKKLLIGAIIGAGIGVIIWVRRRNAAGTAGTPSTPGTDTAGAAAGGTDPNLDPATGFDYGTAQDQAALGSGGGYSDPYMDPATGYDYGTIADQNALSGLFSQRQPQASHPSQTESQWISKAASDLATLAGVSRAAASEALTEWIAGQTITHQQAQYVREALALEGNPPGGAPPIHQHHGHAGHHPPDKDVKVPDVRHKTYHAAAEELADHHLRIRHLGNRAPHEVLSQKPDPGDDAERGSVVTVAGSLGA